ncbi:TonB-dependent receptor [Catenovulum sediminis]|uniref:TonB-dependent receptor n=1 Tax=Catenovulum sediminis TaxID=1740262 RepID=UPI00117E1028|nr:TonB-dependent receptor plug domain-containing protein [Catenovulum sediminis]
MKYTVRYLTQCLGLIGLSASLSIHAQAQSEAKEGAVERIEVVGQESDQAIRLSGFNVDLLLTDKYQNSVFDLNQILNFSPGIHVRSNGGVGSSSELSINGLSGNQIRYFFDGIPMENFGGALSLNNFSGNLVEKMQVYKGVVPIELAADALGGAINIITPSLDENLLDLSYSYGSFNSQNLSVFSQIAFQNNWFVRSSVSLNHSDNDYEMHNINKIENGNVVGVQTVRRFHDAYTSGSINLKAGIQGTELADELSVGVILAANKNEQQHPEKSTNKVFAGVYSKNDSKLFSAIYKKDWQQFGLKGYLLTGKITESFYDTLNRIYAWDGSYTTPNNATDGEFGTQSIFHLTDDILRYNLSADYHLNQQDTLTLSYAHNAIERQGYDEINANNTSFSTPNRLDKSVLGFAYNTQILNDSIRFGVFAKHYQMGGEIIAEQQVEFETVEQTTLINFDKSGFGATLSYQLSDDWLVKTSFEEAVRLPEPVEILGTGKYVMPSPELNPETSRNFNLGSTYRYSVENLFTRTEVNLFLRDTENLIRYVPEQIIRGRYLNDRKVQTNGIELAWYGRLHDYYSLNLNATYENATDQSYVDIDGFPHNHHGDRIPNRPYQYANARFSLDWMAFDIAGLTTSWSINYVGQFFYQWESSGSKSTKFQVPTQATHDLDIEYAFKNDAYRVSFSTRNIFDKAVYDNFNIDKPGRAFYIKFRYLN